MMLTGRVLDAREGQDTGISHYLTDAGGGLDKALELAAQGRDELAGDELRGAAGAAADRRGQPGRGLPARVADGGGGRRERRGQDADAGVPGGGPRGDGEAQRSCECAAASVSCGGPPAAAGRRAETTRIGRFLSWLERERGLAFEDYDALHRWSVDDLDGFWSAVWEYFEVRARPVRGGARPPRDAGRGVVPGREPQLRRARAAAAGRRRRRRGAGYSQTRDRVELTWAQLRDQVARARAGLQRLGVGRGDRVVAYLPNIPETLVAFLATASLGAMWASCAPEFGARSVVDRFGQIEPTVLLAVAGYGYGAKDVDRREQVAEIRAGLPTLRHVVHVPYGENTLPDVDALGPSCSPSRPSRRSTRSRSTTRCACCSPPARPASRRRSCTATAGSCWST